MFNLDTHATFQNGLLLLHLSRAEKTYVFATFYNVAPIFTTMNPKGSTGLKKLQLETVK